MTDSSQPKGKRFAAASPAGKPDLDREQPIRIDDLWEKVRFLKGLLGHAFHQHHFAEKSIADAICTTPPQWTRKKKGANIDSAELGRLLMHFGLARMFDWTVFQLPYGEFVTAMRNAGIGTYGERDGARALQRLLEDPHCRPGGIRLLRLNPMRAGLGAEAFRPLEQRAMLGIGERAKLRIDTPGPGHLLVLNQHYPFGETTCLVPSLFRPSQEVLGGTVELPSESAAQPALEVQGPRGSYRLFAIWARERVRPVRAHAMSGIPRVLADEELMALVMDLQSRTGGHTPYLVHTTEYGVIG